MGSYSPLVESLVGFPRAQELGPGEPDQSAWPRLQAMRVEGMFSGRPILDHEMAEGCLAGLWLYYDYLDHAHEVSQSISTPTGSFWHAIMHRREGDFSNSKYWLRRTGDHPVYPELGLVAAQLATKANHDPTTEFLRSEARWDPYRWVDLCEACVRSDSPATSLCQRIQEAEWRLLFDYCYRSVS